MDRRTFLAGTGAVVLAAPLAAKAQQAGNVPRVGILLLSDVSKQSVGDPFREGLRELGYVDGRTIAIEYRSAEGKEERFPALASELVHLRVDVIFATVAAAVRAAQRATTAIPIVAVVNDPVGAGFVASVARPGGNVTGLSMMSPEVVGKQLELLRQVVPRSHEWPSSRIRPIQGAHHSCATRRLRPRLWGCGFNTSRRVVPARSTAPSRRPRKSVPALSSFCWTQHSLARPSESELQSSRHEVACRRCSP